jgi:pimeloyl-ACP methyl ester carboxylesterase
VSNQKASLATDFISIVGVNLEYILYAGDAKKPTLVFLHEGLGCVEMWREFPQKMAERTGCPVLVYSRQGYGQSDACEVPRPLTYMHIEAQKILPQVLQALGIKQHILIGHSDGGSIALVYAGDNPQPGLLGVVTMAAHVFCEQLTVTSIADARKNYATGELRKGLSRYHKDVDTAFWGWCHAWLDPDFMQWNLEEFLPSIQVPQLVIQGVNDPYGSHLQVESIESKSAGAVQVVMLEGCQHWPYKEQAEASLSAVADFVDGLL